MNIDYIKILKVLDKYGETSYMKPEKFGVGEDRTHYSKLKEICSEAFKEFKKIGSLYSKIFAFELPTPKGNWLTKNSLTNNSEVKSYFSIDLQKHKNDCISLRIIVDKLGYRVVLQNSSLNYKYFYSFLDRPIDRSELSLITDDFPNYEILNKEQEEIRNEAYTSNNSIYLCKLINYTSDTTNQQVEDEILRGVFQLMPYYDLLVENKESQHTKNLILFGPPGTGKTYSSVKKAVEICDNFYSNDYSKIMKHYSQLKNKGQIKFVTFHQSYGYEEFIEGIKPTMSDKKTTNLKYEIADGIFKKFCNNARQDPDTSYVFIIDELNRGNFSKIFGELITLIEETKREGNPEQAECILPYSYEKFSVPNNVYIIGTMNSADRSTTFIDTAIRRRFQFIEMMPDPTVLKALKADKVGDLDVAKILEIINRRIEVLYDREHTIGHAYFTKLAKSPSLITLADIFKNSLIPLLQEYFYDDYKKISLVLGDNDKTDSKYKFIKEVPTDVNGLFKNEIDDSIIIPESEYFINNEAFSYLESYKQILNYEESSNSSRI